MKLQSSAFLFFSIIGFTGSFAQAQSEDLIPDAAIGTSYSDQLPAQDERKPLIYFSLNALPIGIGAFAGAPVVPLEAGIRIAGGLSIGPMATFSGSYRYTDVDLKLSGFGAQAMYNFGQGAISDGFYLQGFYQHYSLSGTKLADVGSMMGMRGMGMQIPLEGSIPINAFGGGAGYQWVWKSGLRISAGVKVAFLKSDSSGLELMGASQSDMQGFNGGSQSPAPEFVKIPVIQDQSAIVPMPELTVGWSI